MSTARGGNQESEGGSGRPAGLGRLGRRDRLDLGLDRLAGRYRLAGWLFLRLLGLVYLIAFASLWVQVDGLLGSRGILPAARYLHTATRVLGPERYRLLPTLFWFGAGDGALHAACAAGVVLALLVIAGVLEVPSLVALWVLYLSLVTVGRDFLSFQWDALLLETGALAVFLPRLALRTRRSRAAPPRPLALLLLWWLLFRLMFSSGAVKLASGDPTWRSLDALKFHYETQPLPTWIGWFAHQLPGWFQVLSVVVMFGIELVVPWLILGTRRTRRIAFVPLVGLQLLIAATGNYGFFNLLTVGLCLLLLDDDAMARVGSRLGRVGRWLAGPLETDREPKAPKGGAGPRRPWAPWGRWLAVPFAAAVFLVSLVEVTGATGLPSPWPRPIYALRKAIAPLRSVNGYGLFAVMTTDRPEIVVEGSDDGATWKAYRCPWKPGPLDRRPRFCEPYMPRLDWQMWFAALGGSPVRSPWFVAFLTRLAEGSPPVLDLLARNPFPDHPPRFLRARLEDYRFTDLHELRASGRWWRREQAGTYLQEVTSERLRALEP